MLAALVGVAALYLDCLAGLITWAVDGLAGVALLAGGIASTPNPCLFLRLDPIANRTTGLCRHLGGHRLLQRS